MTKILLGFLRAYQLLLSPLLGQNCRFQPTCSAYAALAITRFGATKGLWLSLRRVSRCHPIKALGGAHGFDPVPPAPGDLTNRGKRE